jgi:phosphate transport system permease protein
MSASVGERPNSLFKPERGLFHVRRRVSVYVALALTTVFASAAILFLGYFIFYVAREGIQYITPGFFTEEPPLSNSGTGGIVTALEGSLVMLIIASLIGIPLGMAVGIYLAEFGRGRLASVVRFLVDMLTGLPTIVFGLFIWVLIVAPTRTFSGLAGGLALCIIMIPTVARATEEILRLVPGSLREASIALGGTESRTILSVVVPAARSGIITGILLALARVAGETAPLLMTGFGNNFFIPFDQLTVANTPLDAVPLRIFIFTLSPFPVQQHQAFGAAFILLMLVIITSLLVRLATGGFKERGR